MVSNLIFIHWLAQEWPVLIIFFFHLALGQLWLEAKIKEAYKAEEKWNVAASLMYN